MAQMPTRSRVLSMVDIPSISAYRPRIGIPQTPHRPPLKRGLVSVTSDILAAVAVGDLLNPCSSVSTLSATEQYLSTVAPRKVGDLAPSTGENKRDPIKRGRVVLVPLAYGYKKRTSFDTR